MAPGTSRATLLASQEQFLHDASHELRTPVTIARAHLAVLRRSVTSAGAIDTALADLGRIARILQPLLPLATVDPPHLRVSTAHDPAAFLERGVGRVAIAQRLETQAHQSLGFRLQARVERGLDDEAALGREVGTQARELPLAILDAYAEPVRLSFDPTPLSLRASTAASCLLQPRVEGIRGLAHPG